MGANVAKGSSVCKNEGEPAALVNEGEPAALVLLPWFAGPRRGRHTVGDAGGFHC